ncbi:UNC93-like protein 2 [Zancudomyces culisetae]|uniref:UNC93-like protein 2 n=1 Tax=Zancudomyces culisetae TaxID=1213189 RepID=A0A1R1PXE4_ZANCU|nr:UNC93-like protein 2 [Zancudomyces culisetae]|eukprot:OMH85609.1 UNC93-like protein 2 [Zancudomyces culisetae]
MLASFAFSKLLDSKLSRKKRGLISTTMLYVFLNAVWISAYFQHKKFQQIFGDVQNDNDKKLYSYKSTGGAYVWPCLIYAFFGMLDAMIQSLLMWLVGCIGVNNVILSRYVAFVKSTQSVGSGIAWALNAQKINGLVLFLITCVLHLLSMPSTLYLCFTFQDVEKDESECHTERDNRDVPNSPTHASFRESTS